jgi:hypothetical protein
MAMTAEELARIRRRAIRRAIDEETARRMERAGYTRVPMGQGDGYVRSPDPREPEPREPEQTAAQKKTISDAAWNAWFDSRIETRLRAFVTEVLVPFASDVGEVTGKMRGDLRQETAGAIDFAKAEVAEQLQEQIADAVRVFVAEAVAPVRAELDEVKGRLADAEAKLAAATGERRAAPLALGPWGGSA